jgi:hypothetical protein
VSSRGDISTRSWLSSTWDPTFGNWARSWADRLSSAVGKPVKICGIYSGVDTPAGSCRLAPDR